MPVTVAIFLGVCYLSNVRSIVMERILTKGKSDNNKTNPMPSPTSATSSSEPPTVEGVREAAAGEATAAGSKESGGRRRRSA